MICHTDFSSMASRLLLITVGVRKLDATYELVSENGSFRREGATEHHS